MTWQNKKGIDVRWDFINILTSIKQRLTPENYAISEYIINYYDKQPQSHKLLKIFHLLQYPKILNKYLINIFAYLYYKFLDIKHN